MARESVPTIGSHSPPTMQDGPLGDVTGVSSPGGKDSHKWPLDDTPSPAKPGGQGPEPPETREPEDTDEDASELDRYHLGMIKDIDGCDTDDGKRELAREKRAELKEAEQERNSDRKDLGDDGYLNAIRKSGWYVYRRAIDFGSRLAWLLDAALWTNLFIGLWLQWLEIFRRAGHVPFWVYLGAPAAVVTGVVMAFATRAMGRHFGVTRLTIPGHVRHTIDRLVRTAGRCVLSAGLLLLGLLGLMFFAPPSWASWVNQLSNLLSFAANILLGFSAGVGAYAAWILGLPALQDTIDCELEMIRRTRRYLLRFIRSGSDKGAKALALILALFLFSGDVRAADGVWVWAIDVSDSMDPVQRKKGVTQLIETAPDRARAIGATVIQIVKFSEEAGLAEMVWVAVPPTLPQEDCRLATPKTPVEKGLMKWSASFAEGKKVDAVVACQQLQAAQRQRVAKQEHIFLEQLRTAAKTTPRADVTTRLVPMLEELVGKPNTVAIDMLTDGVDHSGKPPEQVTIPDHIRVTFVITRPNPTRRRPTLDDVLAAARAWNDVDGITVTTVAEYAGIWPTLGGR